MTTQQILEAARGAKAQAAQADSEQKNAALRAMADYLIAETGAILIANEADMIASKGQISEVMLDRLRLTKEPEWAENRSCRLPARRSGDHL